ncbi:MAG TPA: PAS domain S-box protein [Gemmataceae bacterium]|nr:PAS domain S-box protein [Gemmataceae bacterium]
MANRDEEERLRAVALQNARSIVLARQRSEEALRRQSDWLRVTLASIGDAVISTDAEGRVTFMNAVAEALTGWTQAEAQGRPLPEVFHIVNEETRQPAENPALRALREGTIVGLANSTLLIARDGSERPIDDSAAPIRDEGGTRAGAVLVFRDITERRAAEAALRQKEAELRDFVENATVGLHWVGPDGTILWANRAELELLGHAKEEYIGRNIVDFHVDRPVIDDIMRRLLSKEEIRGYEARLRCKDGSIKYVIINSSGLWEGERFLHTRCFTHDITDRKRAEEAQARLAAIVESSDDAIVSKTLDAIITSWNQGAERLFGYTAAEAVGRPITLIIPPERLDEEPAILERLRRGERVDHFETVRVAKDGRRLDISLTISPVRDASGRIIGASKIARDITARRRAEAALREQTRLLREVAAAGLTIHSAGSLDSVLRVIAEEARRVLGAGRAVASLTVGDDYAQITSAVSTSAEYERWRESSVPPPVEAACAEVCRTNRPLRMTRAELQAHPAWQESSGRRDQYPPLRGWMAAPLVSRGGKNLGLIRVSDKDDGDFSESEEAVVVQLAHIASVAIENARLYGELREQDRRKDEFLALLAHELRNPLAPLRNGLQVMRLAGADAGAVAQARAMMERQLGHMVRLIDDLLDVSRISRNKMELRLSRVLLADVVSSAVETARPAIEEAGHELTVSLLPEPVHLDADLTRLAQVFGNLLTNSAKYTPRGGHIRLSAEQQGEEVVVSVRDNGIGIPAESLRSIFDMFSQVDRSIERSTGGLGIGLALVKGLVEMHGGTVTAESAGVGKGSTFVVRLPILKEREESTQEALAEEARAAGPKRRILVVDDNRDSAASMAMMLKLTGNEVRTAHDGVEAVEVAGAFRPQAILMDVGMPRLNGYEATRRIREQPWGRSVIIIALTGWGQEGDKLQSREAGCNGHLVKPTSLPELEKALAEAEASR